MFFFSLNNFHLGCSHLVKKQSQTSLLAKLGLSCSSNVKITTCHGAKMHGADSSLYSALNRILFFTVFLRCSAELIFWSAESWLCCGYFIQICRAYFLLVTFEIFFWFLFYILFFSKNMKNLLLFPPHLLTKFSFQKTKMKNWTKAGKKTHFVLTR